MMKIEHSEYSPSTAKRYMRCAGSVAASRGKRNASGASAVIGTAAHALAAGALAGSLKLRVGVEFEYEYDGKKMSHVADEEMTDAVRTYVDYVDTLRRPGCPAFVEHRVDLSHLWLDHGGTLDFASLDVTARTLHVVDYKHGFSPVRVGTASDPNEQLLSYADGMLEFLLKRYKIKWVVLAIVQPRCREVEPVQELRIPAAFVRAWATNDLVPAIRATTVPNAPRVAGEHCHWCPANDGTCRAVEAAAVDAARNDFADVGDPPRVPSTASDLSRVLRAAPMIDNWLRRCEAEAQRILEGGGRIDGFKLVAKKSNRQWPDDLSDAKVLAALKKNGLRVSNVVDDCYTDPKLLGPAQMEKLPGGRDAVAAVAVKPDAGPTLAAESDRRPALGTTTDFEDLV